MSEEQSNHPLNNPPPSNHPLRDAPPEPEKPERGQRIAIRFPGAVSRPLVTYALLIINVVLFLLRYVDTDLATEILLWGVADTQSIIHNREIYRLFTAMFLHLNEAHILFNGIALYYIGGNIERIFGHVRFLLIYLLGGLAGSIAMLFVSVGGLGASGAVFAIWGAEVVFLYQHREIFGHAARARLQNSIVLMVINFFIGFSANAIGTMSGEEAVRIGNSAHLGGLIGGAILTWLVGPRFLIKRIEHPAPGQPPIEVIQANPLRERIPQILYFASGLAGLVLLVIVLRT